MMEKPSYIALTQYFKGEASKEVMDEVTSWQDTNQEEFSELQSIWDKYGSLATSYQPDVSAAWDKIDERTAHSNNPWIIRIAATIVLGIGIGWMIQSNWFSKDAAIESYHASNEKLIIELDDKTMVTLSPGSNILLTEGYGFENREVRLVGKGFFEVANNESLPFEVQVDKMTVSVLGTAFEVEQNPQLIEVTVTEGKVSVEVANDKLELVENEKALFDLVEETLIKSQEFDENHLAWKTLTLSFTNTRLEDFVSDLETFYSVEIEIVEELKDRRITAEFNNQPLSEVFEIVRATLGVKIDTLNDSNFRIE